MQKRSLWTILLMGLALPLAGLGCVETVSGGGSGGAGGGGGSGGNSAALQWYTTCGDPVCSMYMMKPGVALCTSEKEGDPCSSEGTECDPIDNCNALLRCAASDPKDQPGGCPISRARHKTDIRYLDDRDLNRVSDELMSMRLASWRYKAEAPDAPARLGFIIDDNPDSASVESSGERVDVYGYTSMAVAALQIQAGRIEAMEREMQALREELLTLKQKTNRCDPSP